MQTLALTPFAAWLEEELKRRNLNRAQLAAYIGKRPQTVYGWFNDGRIPETAQCLLIAKVLRLPADDVLRIAGHLPALAEDRAEYDSPSWVELLPMLSSRDAEYVGRLVESMAQHPVQPDESPPPEAPQ